MQVIMAILWQEILFSIWVPILLLILLVVLLSALVVQRRRLNNCHRAIVRLIYEKEVLKKELPLSSPYRYVPPVMTRSELLSIVSVTNSLLAELSGERVDQLEKQMPTSSDLLIRHSFCKRSSDIDPAS